MRRDRGSRWTTGRVVGGWPCAPVSAPLRPWVPPPHTRTVTFIGHSDGFHGLRYRPIPHIPAACGTARRVAAACGTRLARRGARSRRLASHAAACGTTRRVACGARRRAETVPGDRAGPLCLRLVCGFDALVAADASKAAIFAMLAQLYDSSSTTQGRTGAASGRQPEQASRGGARLARALSPPGRPRHHPVAAAHC